MFTYWFSSPEKINYFIIIKLCLEEHPIRWNQQAIKRLTHSNDPPSHKQNGLTNSVWPIPKNGIKPMHTLEWLTFLWFCMQGGLFWFVQVCDQLSRFSVCQLLMYVRHFDARKFQLDSVFWSIFHIPFKITFFHFPRGQRGHITSRRVKLGQA